MGVREIQAKSILQKSGLPGVSYAVNPYVGCVHGCVYCYARFMKRFTGHTEPWGSFLDARVNAPEVLRRELARRAPLAGTVFLSSVTDPYQPPEARYRLTRGVLEALLEHQAPVDILTKSDLVLRDLDLLRQFKDCTVGLSLSTFDDTLARRMEPRAAPPSRRRAALQALHDAGVRTYAFISPYLPHLSADVEELLEALQGSVDEVGVEALNPTGANWAGVEAAVRRHYPERLEAHRQAVRDDGYWTALEQQARQAAARLGIVFTGFYRH